MGRGARRPGADRGVARRRRAGPRGVDAGGRELRTRAAAPPHELRPDRGRQRPCRARPRPRRRRRRSGGRARGRCVVRGRADAAAGRRRAALRPSSVRTAADPRRVRRGRGRTAARRSRPRRRGRGRPLPRRARSRPARSRPDAHPLPRHTADRRPAASHPRRGGVRAERMRRLLRSLLRPARTAGGRARTVVGSGVRRARRALQRLAAGPAATGGGRFARPTDVAARRRDRDRLPRGRRAADRADRARTDDRVPAAALLRGAARPHSRVLLAPADRHPPRAAAGASRTLRGARRSHRPARAARLDRRHAAVHRSPGARGRDLRRDAEFPGAVPGAASDRAAAHPLTAGQSSSSICSAFEMPKPNGCSPSSQANWAKTVAGPSPPSIAGSRTRPRSSTA